MSKHISVMLTEVIDALDIKEDGTYVDATLGYGGHSAAILERVKRGYLFAFDQDQQAIEYSTKRLSKIGNNFKIIDSNFVKLKEGLDKEHINEVDGILFDLGVSSPQLDEAERGFSYHNDAYLDMRMDQRISLTAHEVVNNYSLADLTSIFREYGDEKYAYQVAKKIIKAREEKEVNTTLELVEIIKEAIPKKDQIKKHPAKKIFQALRIEVNQEMEILKTALEDAITLLKPGGIICIISFHSLEDRIVKNILSKHSKLDNKLMRLPSIPDNLKPVLKRMIKVKPSSDEIINNKRSRSAILRVGIKRSE